ncbi:hypothetical protein E1264_22780 [Actinomadura sp. KC216]|uniref:MAC/perforin domain-containing protein n=1 Tax=Actinomadura sp. KC216 TaxID=2530370 RepID=UPI001042A508|nr:MAC/perforin domain-containing protein [Actinomadura sp. KC216]TDB84984.1 hypothetical protein E1264_22780 [Actinomadura sp. KC216]
MTLLHTTAHPILSQANAVGQGFDIYGTMSDDSLITPLFDLAESGYHTFTFLGHEWDIPNDVLGREDTKTYFYSVTGEARDELQASLSAELGVSASYGAFSGEFKSEFSGEYTRSSEYMFSYHNMYAQLARLQLAADPKFPSKAFTDRVAQLPATFDESELRAFIEFFDSFGIYYTTEVSLGASLGFWVATEKRSQMAKAEISAMLNAQYKGLFSSGSISSKIRGSSEWKAYSSNSSVGIRAIGADPAKGARVAALDPWNPSQASVEAYNAWVDSIATDPAIVDFKLRGIWELCGDRRRAVQEAWQAYGQTMRPKLMITTSTTLYPPPEPRPPAITIGHLLKPPNPPAYNAGYQLIVLDGRKDITTEGAVLFDRYYGVDAKTWSHTYTAMYQTMAEDVTAQGLLMNGNILVLAGYNMNWDAVPSPEFIDVLRAAGCGEQLTHWLQTANPGSAIGFPANIMAVGILGQGIGTAIEFMVRENEMKPIPAELGVLFFRNPDGSGYTMSTG